MTTPDEIREARALRRRHKHERQAVIFGVLIAFLAVTGLASVAVYTGTIDPPFDRGFTVKEEQTDAVLAQPCLPPGTLPVPYDQVIVNVLNATERGGLASTAATSLTERGFIVATTDNATVAVAGIRISFGTQGLAAAYTLAAHFEGADFYYDTRTDATIDVSLGTSFEGVRQAEAVQLDPTIPMISREGCVALEKITPQPLPTADGEVPPEEAPVEEAPVEEAPVEEAPVEEAPAG